MRKPLSTFRFIFFVKRPGNKTRNRFPILLFCSSLEFQAISQLLKKKSILLYFLWFPFVLIKVYFKNLLIYFGFLKFSLNCFLIFLLGFNYPFPNAGSLVSRVLCLVNRHNMVFSIFIQRDWKKQCTSYHLYYGILLCMYNLCVDRKYLKTDFWIQ